MIFGKRFMYNHRTSLSILLFLVIAIIIQSVKPSMIYNADGSYRDFGLGYKDKTVIPIWLFIMIMAIGSYMFFCLSSMPH
jgi:hypothetical protein